MKSFVIETRKGFFTIPERIAGYSFPMSSRATLSGATRFPFKSAAERIMNKYHLKDAPLHAHIEEVED